jgi:hypothetical protein
MAPWRIVRETFLAAFGDDEQDEKNRFVDRTTEALKERDLTPVDEDKGIGYLIRQRRRGKLTRIDLVEEEFVKDDDE